MYYLAGCLSDVVMLRGCAGCTKLSAIFQTKCQCCPVEADWPKVMAGT